MQDSYLLFLDSLIVGPLWHCGILVFYGKLNDDFNTVALAKVLGCWKKMQKMDWFYILLE